MVGEFHLLAHASRIGWSAAAYAVTSGRIALRARGERRSLRRDDRLVFVVGSPRSGTSFSAECLGVQPGFVDLGEVPLLKAAIPGLVGAPQARQTTAIHRILERVRALAMATSLRGVEQTPETAFVLAAALKAYPNAHAVHVVRDGRDVACSLIERGWLRDDRSGGDGARQTYGGHARFWVEPERREEFERASEAKRAAWAWRAYVSAVRSIASDRILELRYERLVAAPHREAERVAVAIGGDPDALAGAFHGAHGGSIGRWRRDLTPEQLAEVEQEAGSLLAELGYTLSR